MLGFLGTYDLVGPGDPLPFLPSWYRTWSEPRNNKPVKIAAIALIASGLTYLNPTVGETVSLDKWYAPLASPVRIKPNIGVPRQQAFFAEPFGETQAEAVLESKFHFPWTEPVRIKPGLKASLQLAFTADTNTFPTNVGMGWYAPFPMPVRLPKGLKFYLQRYDTQDSVFVFNPFRLIPYFMALSEPLRPKPGLKAYLQQTAAYHPRILPNPNVTLVLAATETNNDVALFGLDVYNSSGTVTSGEGARVSIIEVAPSGTGPTSIRES